jgi:Peptidase family M48
VKIFASLILFSFITLNGWACDGGMQMNRVISIPANSILANDMTEKEFKDSAKYFENFFGPSIDRDHNAELIVFSSWASNTVNAFAEKKDNKVMITIFGGLARHKAITHDGLTAVLCHELGHHFGGYPKKAGNTWSSAEGQSDYYATMKCLRRIWEKADNEGAMLNVVVPEMVKAECAMTYGDAKAQVLCHRMSLAGRSVALMIQDLDHDSLVPNFETPDPLVVRTTSFMHPYSQCRLDTFFQGAICPVSDSVEFDDDDQTKGSCHGKQGDTRGLRPRCWFAPRI